MILPRLLAPAFAAALIAASLPAAPIPAAEYQPKPADPYFAIYNPRLAPAPGPLLLRAGDHLAIIGDSITEQRLYSRIIETYLTVCRPDLAIECRQLGWSGETVEGFRRRVDNDCLRFHPTVATLCYGMNDSKYRPYDEANGAWFRDNLTALVEQLKAAHLRLVVGSPGMAEKPAVWVKSRAGTVEEHNLNLCTLRDIALDVATHEDERFADVFWPLLTSAFTARARYGADPETPYQLIGRDGIHPNWAGHLIMADAFLRALGLDGEVGTFTVDLTTHTATASTGHHVDSFDGTNLVITSERYPFCADGPVNRDDSIRSGMSLVPFNQDLNRLMLVVKGRPNASYLITWGDEFRTYSADELAKGVNLAEAFPHNPFSRAFAAVDEAVARKQEYETRQVKQLLHGPEGKQDLEGTVARTEAERAKLLAAIQAAHVPVRHTIEIHVR